MKKILRNAIRCNKCGEVIVSESEHDYVTCECGTCAFDGGHDYLRRCAPSQDAYTELSEIEKIRIDDE